MNLNRRTFLKTTTAVGGGLMIGGRGLPSNLKSVQTTSDGVKVRKLDAKSYLPGGNTALNDAIGITVRKIDADRPRVDKVVTVIMTDGEENSSREWTHDAVKALISQKESEGTWTFVFLGASPEAWDQGRGYGIPAANVAQYDVNHYRATFACMARGTNVLAASAAPRATNLFASVSKTILEKAGIRQASEKS